MIKKRQLATSNKGGMEATLLKIYNSEEVLP
jgi:hypothetical protein